MKVITKTVYVCEICEAEYETAADARLCETMSVPKPDWNVGDIAYVKYHGSMHEVRVTGVYPVHGYHTHHWLITKEPDYMTRDSDHYNHDQQGFACHPDELHRSPDGT